MRLRFFGIWVLSWLMLGGAQAGPPDSVFTPETTASDARSFRFRVSTPALSAAPDGSGAYRIALDGFRSRDARPGAPDLPYEIVRIAIPEGVVPRIEVRAAGEDRLPGVRPRAVPTVAFDVPPEEPGESPERPRRSVVRHERAVEDPALFGAAAIPPVAELGAIGRFRDQRFVEVKIRPVRWNGRALVVARSFEVVVHFDGDAGSRSAPRVSRFEDLYRETFLNYAQGTTFRGGEAVEPAAAASSIASSGPIRRIRVREDGVVRIDAARVSGTPFAGQPLSQWKLTNRGVEIPLDVRDSNLNDLLDPGDWVEFWGERLDDEPKTVLNTDLPFTDKDVFEYRDFTDENVYFLTIEAGARARIAARDAAPTNVRTPPNDFEETSHQEVDSPDGWRPLGAADPWYWTPTLTSGGASDNRTVNVPLPGLASGTVPARVLAKIRGLSENFNLAPDHKTRVTLQNASNVTLATNDDDGTFDGRTLYTHDFTWPGTGGTLTDPAKVRIDARPIASGTHQVILDWVEVKYRRLFLAEGDELVFAWPDGDSEFVVSNLASASPRIYELTGGTPTRLVNATVSGAGPYTVRFRVDADGSGGERRFVVFGDGAVTVPASADFAEDTVSDLRTNRTQADLIVIAHPGVYGPLSQARLASLLAWRQANQGITSRVVLVQDIEDEFQDGLPGPVAIRNFLRWVMTPGDGWDEPKPTDVLLLGDSSYDYKSGTGNGTFVPTQILFKDDPSFGYYASDNLFGMVLGDDLLPELSVGRLTARSDVALDAVLGKVLDYEQSAPTGNWRRHAVVVSDRGKGYSVDEAVGFFEATNDRAVANMKVPPHTYRRMRYWSDPRYCGGVISGCTTDFPDSAAERMRSDIKAAVNGTDGMSDGAAILQFAGHGNFNVWSDDAFFSQGFDGFFDVDDLINGGRLPLLVAHNCLTGAFMSTSTVAVGEDWLERQGGGSIGVLSPSGLSTTFVGDVASDRLWGDLFGPRKERDLGNAGLGVALAICGSGDVLPCQSLVLLGDPAVDLALPSVAPPRDVLATGGNAQVSVSWTASATLGATYDVYRRLSSSTSYTKINASPISGTSYLDTGVVNARTYYYYVVALDAEGFESRWSNFNSDCDVSGPDCVQATPLNPNPPAPPTGLVVTDPETGGKLNLTWNPNSESDLQNYEVRYGTTPGVYPSVRNVGKNTADALTGLENGTTYYIVITATNTSGKTSAPSEERSGTPTFVRGTRSPDFIATLRVNRSGIDAALSWDPVTTDIYGKPETVAHYEIFRSTTPDFVPGAGNKVGQVTGTTFTDPGTMEFADPNYHWLVRAVDVDGNLGGAGYQLPNGIDALTLSKSTVTPGNVILSWPAVTTDFDGNPTRIARYDVYAAGAPFTREAIRDGSVPLLQSTTATSIEITPDALSRYYSVLVVDTRGNTSSF